MSEVIKSVNLKDGNVLEVYQDESPISPRCGDEELLGYMAIFHNSYDLGDKNIPFTADDFSDWSEMKEHIEKKLRAVVCLPVYMYSHSGITIRTTPFSCPWDSGQIGFIYTTNKRLSELSINIKSNQSWSEFIEEITKQLISEVKFLNYYITGEVYSFTIKDQAGDEVDSCSGFYGDDFKNNGILDYVSSEPINLDDL